MTNKPIMQMTNEELLNIFAEGVKFSAVDERGCDAFREIERRMKNGILVPDPAPSEPEYGWEDLAVDLNLTFACECLYQNKYRPMDHDLLRGTCVRLMREKGWDAAYAKPAPDTMNEHQFFWAYAECIGERELVGSDYAPSEPAAYRDMLKHAGVIQ
jgi:hypothetical protein